ncbi:MAG: hypothetical protein KHX13_04805 [Acidaminococcus intestini]|uniref:Uncharacterized protein n=1 Tax=Acidaminococcus intestini TaxID=187327 RepID=A0A943I4K2_9FIRM|nr:hypothetical protein [Acidaminococcus intestini]
MQKDNSWNFKGCKYKTREETLGIHLDFTPIEMDAYDFGRRQVGKGWLNIGYHYIIHLDGSIERGIPEEQYADPSILHFHDCICVLVMGVGPAEIDQWKRMAWPLMEEKLGLKLPLIGE